MKSNALLLALAGAGLGIPLLLILLDESENAFADIHSAAVSSGILLRLKVEHLALAIGVICTLIALPGATGPVPELPAVDRFGVCAAVRRGAGGSLHPAQAQWLSVASAALRWPALLAWLGGVSTYHLLANLYPDIGATLPALILAGLLQLVLGRAFSYGQETARA